MIFDASEQEADGVDGGAGTVGVGVPTTMNILSQNKITYFKFNKMIKKTKERFLICFPPTPSLLINYCVKFVHHLLRLKMEKF